MVFLALICCVVFLLMLIAWIERRAERHDKNHTVEIAKFIADHTGIQDNIDPFGLSVKETITPPKTPNQ